MQAKRSGANKITWVKEQVKFECCCRCCFWRAPELQSRSYVGLTSEATARGLYFSDKTKPFHFLYHVAPKSVLGSEQLLFASLAALWVVALIPWTVVSCVECLLLSSTCRYFSWHILLSTRNPQHGVFQFVFLNVFFKIYFNGFFHIIIYFKL